jgi:hypothetical protein
MRASPSRLPLRPLGLLAFGLLLAAPHSARAQTEPPAKEISEKTSAGLGKLRPLIDAKNYNEALNLIDSLLVTAAYPSYDLAILSQIKSQLLLTTNQYSAAIPPLETALQIGERYGFFDERTRLDSLYLLSQLYYQTGSDSKQPAEQNRRYDQAYAAITRWLSLSPTPTAEAQLYAASIVYGQAIADPAHIDLAKLAQARTSAEQSLYLDAKPKDQAYLLILAALQQSGDLTRVAELLELLVSKKPESTAYWQQLSGTYYALASESKKPADSERYNLRALLTLERAQARGLLNSPRENYAIVALYFTLQQFDRAITLLQTGLKAGTIENTKRNWELLAASYQQSHAEPKAIETYQQAITRFPKDASLEFSLGQLLYAQNRPAEALTHLELATTKEGLDRPGQAQLYTAYVAFELQRYDAAAQWLDSAAKQPDAKKDDIERLRRAVTEKVRERAPAVKI